MTTAEKIKKALDATIQASGVTEEEIRSRQRKFSAYTARGVYYILCRELCIPPLLYSAFVGRSRPSAVIATKRYHGYYITGDIIVRTLIDKARKIYYGE